MNKWQALRNARLEGMMASRLKNEEPDETQNDTLKRGIELDLEPVCYGSKGDKATEDEDVEEVEEEEYVIENKIKKFEISRQTRKSEEEEKKTVSSRKASIKKKKSCFVKISGIRFLCMFINNYSILLKNKTFLLLKNKSTELDKWIEEPSTQESDSEPDSDFDALKEKPGILYTVKTKDPKFANYWHIQNIFRYIQVGDRSFTLLCMCDILDFDLSQEKIALSIHEANGVKILINILEVIVQNSEILKLS